MEDNHKNGKSKNPISKFKEIGEWKGGTQQGSRTDLTTITDKIVKEGATLKRIAEEHPEAYVVYNRGFSALYTKTVLPKLLGRPKEIEVIWNYGQPGSGKSSSVLISEGYENVYEVPYPTQGKRWYHNYDNQKILMLDDVVKTYRYKELLKILEPRILQLEIKGNFEPGMYNKVYINDTYPPWQIFSKSYDYQLARRITSLIKWEGVYPLSATKVIPHKDNKGRFAIHEYFTPDNDIVSINTLSNPDGLSDHELDELNKKK